MKAIALFIAGIALAAVWPQAYGESPTEIDLLIVHTPAVTSDYGGTSGVEAHAIASVTSVNDAMEDSLIPVVLNLVAVEEVNYTESVTSLRDDLYAIAGKSDPVDPVHADVLALRDHYGADLVTLFRDGLAGRAAGLAYIIDPADDRQDLGYAVVSAQAALSNLTLAHELGHNLGSAHARGEIGKTPPIDEARGYKFQANDTDYRTIMSVDFSPTRLTRFSSAAATYEGVATGKPPGDPEAADNAAAFVVSAPVTAGFRLPQTAVPTVLAEPVGDTVVPGGGTRLRALLGGFPPLTVEWFRGKVGETSHPLTSTEIELERGGTESFVDLSGISATTPYWLRVANPNGDLDSRNYEVVVVNEPAGTSSLVEQAFRDNGFRVTFSFEQELTVPAAAYLRTLRLVLARVGNPPNPTVRFEKIGGDLVFEQELDASLVAAWPTLSEHDFSAAVFAAPGAQYRVTLIPYNGEDQENYMVWHYADAANVSDPNVGESNLSDGSKLMFSLLGTEAWTYHTWLESSLTSADSRNLLASDRTEGLPNIVRYATGGDFGTPAADLRPQALDLESGADGMEAAFRYTRRPGLVDVSLLVQQSQDLGSWTTIDAANIQSLGPTADGDEAFEARIPFNENQLFLRLRAQNQPASQ